MQNICLILNIFKHDWFALVLPSMEAHALVMFLCSEIQVLSLICVLVVLLCPSDDDIMTLYIS